MLEGESLRYSPEVEIISTADQDRPFATKRSGDTWQLAVNKNHFLARGFTPNEIEGAVALEEQRLIGQISSDTVSQVDGLSRWQGLSANDVQASAFKTAFERLAALSILEKQNSPKAGSARRYLGKFADRPPGNSNSDQLFSAILRKGLGKETEIQSDLAKRVVANLDRKEDIEGRQVSPLEALVSPDLSFDAKAGWFEARFLPRFEFLKSKDDITQEQKPDSAKEEAEQKEQAEPPVPPPSEDEHEQHRGREEKGKGQPIFTINPGFTGYWETDSFDIIDESTGRTKKSDVQKIKTAFSKAVQVIDSSKRSIHVQSGMELFNLPLAPFFQITKQGIEELKAKGAEVFSDTEGHIFVKSPRNQPLDIEVVLAGESSSSTFKSQDKNTSLEMPDEIRTRLGQIKDLAVSPYEKATEWQDLIKKFFRYPKDEEVEKMYSDVDKSVSRLSAMAQGKLLDCYLAREFFVAGLKRLGLNNLEWRAVQGYFAAGKQKDGTVHLHSGNAHAWVKVRGDGEKNWIIFDPTPPGDPIHQGESALDEFGELSPDLLSDKDIESLQEEAKANEERQKHPESAQDHYLMEFANQAGITPEEANEILAILKEADQMKDKQGRSILARLKEQFDRIIESYTQESQEYFGPVKMSRGQQLKDPVAALLDIKAGSLDPTGFSRKRIIEEKQEYYGGVDLEIVADGSGSMSESLDGVVKFLMQRNMCYLLHRALHRFSQDAQRRKLRLVTPLKIRSSQFIFRGNNIEQVKPLSEDFTPLQMALLWKKSAENIGGGTPAHLGLQAVLDKIPPEEVQLLRDKKLLKVIALISDGDYGDPDRVANLIKRARDMNIIVDELHITDRNSLDELPQNVAEKFIEATKVLMPEKIKR